MKLRLDPRELVRIDLLFALAGDDRALDARNRRLGRLVGGLIRVVLRALRILGEDRLPVNTNLSFGSPSIAYSMMSSSRSGAKSARGCPFMENTRPGASPTQLVSN